MDGIKMENINITKKGHKYSIKISEFIKLLNSLNTDKNIAFSWDGSRSLPIDFHGKLEMSLTGNTYVFHLDENHGNVIED